MRSYSHCRSASATVFDFDDPVTRHLDLGPEVLQLAALTQRLNLEHLARESVIQLQRQPGDVATVQSVQSGNLYPHAPAAYR